MEELGQKLRDARERLGITLEEVEKATRIRTHHLAALERGDVDALPSPVQVRGFLGNYADFLGLDTSEMLLEYAEKLQSRSTKLRVATPARELNSGPSVQIHSRRPRWLSFDLFFTATIIFGVIAVLLWGANHLMQSLRGEAQVTDEALGFLIPSETPTLTPAPPTQPAATFSNPEGAAPEPETVEPTQPIILGLNSEVNLRILAKQRTWLRVIVDGEEVFSGRMLPGQEKTYTGLKAVEVTTGNGAGVRIYYNGQDQGYMGEVGQVVLRVWTLDGVLTPTPTQTQTPTASPPPTETPPTTPTSQQTTESGL